MFEISGFAACASGAARPLSPAGAVVSELRARVLTLGGAVDEAGLIDQISELERLKSAAAAVQARLTAELDDRRDAATRARELLAAAAAEQDVPSRRRAVTRPHPDAGLGKEVGLARRESPHEGRRKLHLARALVHDLPHTLAALERGDLNERRAEIIAGEVRHLTPTIRREVDAALVTPPEAITDPAAADEVSTGAWEGVGDAALRDVVRREVLRRDEEGWLARHARAFADRRVSARVIGDGMARLSAVISATAASTILASLHEAIESARQDGDERTRAQLSADTMVERLTGSVFGRARPVALKLLLSAETLLADDHDDEPAAREPGYLMGCGYVPASVARRLAREGAGSLKSTVQRIFQAPNDGALIAMESSGRLFRGPLAEFLLLRDRRCRNPWCNGQIRHRDHVLPHHQGGPTSRDNGQGLCEACNYAKEGAGWQHTPVADPLAVTEIVVTTPTGHRHRSRAPAQPMPMPDEPATERHVAQQSPQHSPQQSPEQAPGQHEPGADPSDATQHAWLPGGSETPSALELRFAALVRAA